MRNAYLSTPTQPSRSSSEDDTIRADMPMNPLLSTLSGKRIRTSSDMESVSSSPGVKGFATRSIRSTESSSNVDDGNNGENFVEIVKTKLTTHIAFVFAELWERLQHPLETRLYFFLSAMTILSLALFSLGADGDMLGLSATQWYLFMGIITGSVVFACIFEESLFLLIDRGWRGREEVRLYLHCLNGPLGFIAALGLVKYLLQRQNILRLIVDWRLYMSAAVVVWMCYTLKSFYHRRRFNAVLVSKFEGRMTIMEMQAKVLSVLASCHPAKRKPSVTAGPAPALAAARTQSGEDARLNALDKLKASPFVAKLTAAAKINQDRASNLKNLFSEIVLASEEATPDDDSCNGMDSDSSDQRTFWDRLKAVSKGYLLVQTVNGRLIMRRRRHVLSFSRRLYTFLSRMGHRKVTGRHLCDAIRSSDYDESMKEGLIRELCEMFHTADDSKSFVSAESVNAACMAVFDKYKSGATLLSDFGEVTRQVAAVMDVLFWIVMLMVVQYIVKWPIESVFAPLLTLVFGVSFALGPTVSQVCMAIAFVSFTLPFEPGDRIAVGIGSNKIIVIVESISLLRTTVKTLLNETLFWPNHLLYSERIINLTQSPKATVEIPVSFALNGRESPSQAQIAEFWKRVSDYCLEENKQYWDSIAVISHTLDAGQNLFGYSLWATSVYSFGQAVEFRIQRCLLIDKMRETQKDLGISFVDIKRPVDVEYSASPPPVLKNDDGNIFGK